MVKTARKVVVDVVEGEEKEIERESAESGVEYKLVLAADKSPLIKKSG